MRVAIAPNAFRGSLSAVDAAASIAQGLAQSRLNCTVDLWPMADGGDGTLDLLLRAMGGERIPFAVTGADGQPTQADLGLMADGQTAVIELAQASGVEKSQRRPHDALSGTTFGTGELITAALERGYRRLIVGLGGSATTDGGAGLVQALGARLLDAHDQPISPGGAGLRDLARIDASALRLLYPELNMIVLCDVDNPLTGEHGAARVFAPQKGADTAAVEVLEAGLSHYADIIQRDLGIPVEALPGGGAAGGTGAGLAAFLNASLTPGAEMLFTLLGYAEQMADCDLLITGEGKLDAQTAGGKVIQAVATQAIAHNIPTVALVGTLACAVDDYRRFGLDAAWSIVPGPVDLEMATNRAAEWLTDAARRLGDTLAIRLPKA